MTIRRVGLVGLGATAVVALLAPTIAPNPPGVQFRDHLYAPPMPIRIIDDAGRVRAPFVYPLRIVDRLERRFEEDRSVRQPLVWLRGGHLVQVADRDRGPLLLLGADQLGRDVFSRLVLGARPSLGVAAAASLLALLIGAVVGAVAGIAGGWPDELLMRAADFVLVLPALYVVLALRAVTPLVLPSFAVFVLMMVVFAVVGWPVVARGVRAVVRSEREQDYALAARGLGVGPWGLLFRHLLPAAYGFLAVQAALLMPGFILAEATLSFVGLGFPDRTSSWGVMLQDASNVRAIVDFPWLLTPAAAIMAVVLAVNLVARSDAGRAPSSRFGRAEAIGGGS